LKSCWTNVFSPRLPSLMLTSLDKIDLVMNFWVNQLGWNSLALAKCPDIFSFSLEKRIIPRASVLQFLLTKGLREKNRNLAVPLTYREELFLSKFVFSFYKLYEEKIKLASIKENINMPIHKMWNVLIIFCNLIIACSFDFEVLNLSRTK